MVYSSGHDSPHRHRDPAEGRAEQGRDRRARPDRDGHRGPGRDHHPAHRAGVRRDADGAVLARREQGRAARSDGRRPPRGRDASGRRRLVVRAAACGRRDADRAPRAAPGGGGAGLPPHPGDRAGPGDHGVHADPARGRRVRPPAGGRPRPDGSADRDDAGDPAPGLGEPGRAGRARCAAGREARAHRGPAGRSLSPHPGRGRAAHQLRRRRRRTTPSGSTSTSRAHSP